MHKHHQENWNRELNICVFVVAGAVAGDILVLSAPQRVRETESLIMPLPIVVLCAQSSNIHLEDASVLGAQSPSTFSNVESCSDEF